MIKRSLGFVATVCVAAGLVQAHHSLAGVDGSSAEWVLAQRGISKTGPNGLHTAEEIKVKFLPAR